MNIIAGKYRGRKIKTLEGREVRPTTQRIKEDMFNILNNYFIFEGKTSLDLFAGSGALSLEGISRGIKKAYINDKSKSVLTIIKENLTGIDVDSYELMNLEYLNAIKYLQIKGVFLDLIYIDPPFSKVEYYYNFFEILAKSKILNDYGIVIIESENSFNLTKIEKIKLLKHKIYKKQHLYIFRREDEE